jgi:hypothetical protein
LALRLGAVFGQSGPRMCGIGSGFALIRSGAVGVCPALHPNALGPGGPQAGFQRCGPGPDARSLARVDRLQCLDLSSHRFDLG